MTSEQTRPDTGEGSIFIMPGAVKAGPVPGDAEKRPTMRKKLRLRRARKGASGDGRREEGK